MQRKTANANHQLQAKNAYLKKLGSTTWLASSLQHHFRALEYHQHHGFVDCASSSLRYPTRNIQKKKRYRRRIEELTESKLRLQIGVI
ncbi:unnamed protein product [Lathyrus oleraceus]